MGQKPGRSNRLFRPPTSDFTACTTHAMWPSTCLCGQSALNSSRQDLLVRLRNARSISASRLETGGHRLLPKTVWHYVNRTPAPHLSLMSACTIMLIFRTWAGRGQLLKAVPSHTNVVYMDSIQQPPRLRARWGSSRKRLSSSKSTASPGDANSHKESTDFWPSPNSAELSKKI